LNGAHPASVVAKVVKAALNTLRKFAVGLLMSLPQP
jgi:hypothetical protein